MKNVFFKNIQQHVRHSTIISHIVADPQTWGRWRGISKMTTTGEFWRQTETHSWSFVFAHIKKLSLKEKERKGWKERSAKGRGGVGVGGVIGQPLLSWRKKLSPQLCSKSYPSWHQPQFQPPYKEDGTWIFPSGQAKEKEMLHFSDTWEMRRSDDSIEQHKRHSGTVKHILDFSLPT